MSDPLTELTDRERFCLLLMTGPLLSADAILVLAGEDGIARTKTAVELYRAGAAPVIVLAGDRHEPPRILSGEALSATALGGGVAPDRIFHAPAAHTHAQAALVAQLATERQWVRLLLVASPYHLPRAFLTFVRSFTTLGIHHTLRLVPAPSAHTPWFQPPPGAAPETRLDLLAVEFAKCAQYVEHVATWAEGLDYLKYWEGR